MSDFAKYQTAKAETRAAYERYNYAGAALELAQIKERLAEMASQHDPLAALQNEAVSDRDRLYAAAHYAVVGHLPNAEITCRKERSE